MKEEAREEEQEGAGVSDVERARLARIGRMGAHVAHSRHDGETMTGPARRAFLARFELEVDPNGELDSVERQRRAAHARSVYFSRLASKRGTQ